MFEFMQSTFLQNRIQDYFITISIILLGLFLVRITKKMVLNRVTRFATHKNNQILLFVTRDLTRTFMPVLYYAIFSFSIKNLVVPAILTQAINFFGVIILTLCTVRFILNFFEFLIRRSQNKFPEDSQDNHLLLLKPVVTVIIWGVGIVFLLDNLGFKISAIVAGLGIGGIAIALAAQAVLGDLFSYFAILFDKPFKLGDFIIIDSYLGVIEHIGIKTTRIRSLSGEQLIFSNTDLTSSRVRNFKRMERRRVVFKIGVTYQTPREKIIDIPVFIKKIIENIADTQFDRAHFSSFGNFSLDFEVVYYILGADYNKYMDIQQQINLEIMREFEERNIDFAYPTQTLYLNQTQTDFAVQEIQNKTINE